MATFPSSQSAVPLTTAVAEAVVECKIVVTHGNLPVASTCGAAHNGNWFNLQFAKIAKESAVHKDSIVDFSCECRHITLQKRTEGCAEHA